MALHVADDVGRVLVGVTGLAGLPVHLPVLLGEHERRRDPHACGVLQERRDGDEPVHDRG